MDPEYSAIEGLCMEKPTERRMRLAKAQIEAIKLEFILKLKIKRNDWLLADTCPQAANHCDLF